MLHTIREYFAGIPAQYVLASYLYLGFIPVVYWVCRDARAPRWVAFAIALTWPICVLVCFLYSPFFKRH